MGVVTVAAVALTGSDAVADPAPAVIGAPPPETDAPDTEPVPPPTTQAPGPDPVDVETASTSTSSTTTTTMPTPAPLTVAVFGDSVPAWLLRDAAASFDRTDVIVLNGAREACDGMVDLPVGRDRRGDELVPPDDCLDWTVSYPETLANADRTDVALLVIGQAPVVDHLIDDVWQGPCDGIDWYLEDVRLRIAFLRGEGVRPVLAIPAPYGQRVSFMVEDDHRERIGCVRSAMLGFAGELDLDHIDLDEFLCPAGDCDARRDADGIHVDSEFAPEVLDELLDRVVQTMELDAA